MFVHLLVWDEHYASEFFGELLAAIFDITTYCEHVILVVPPRVTPADVFEREMTKVLVRGTRDTDALQFLYLDDRHRLRPKLRVRRAVEEDNDNVIPIIDGECTRLRELYGPYYISEMIRYPDGCRQLIIGEDADGSTAGVVCLNSTIDVDQLNENFELTPYHGLRKACKDNETSADVAEATSELLHSAYARGSPHDHNSSGTSRVHKVAANEPREKRSNEENGKASPTREQIETTARTKILFRSNIQDDSVENLRKREIVPQDTRARSTDLIRPFESKRLYKLHLDRFLNSRAPSPNDSRITSLSDLPLISDYFDTHFQSKLQETIFSDAAFELFHNEVTRSQLIHDVLPHPTYHGEINAFVLEIFSMRKDAKPHWSRDFLEAAFDCFLHLDYCVILLPSSHPCQQFLQHFVRVPLRCNKDFPMMLYVAHRAVFREKIECRRGQVQDRKAVEELLLTVPTRQEILVDFDLTMDPLQPDLRESFVFMCNNRILGFAILCAEKRVDFIRSHYHVEDHVIMQSIRPDEYGHLLHFVLMPIFSAYHPFFCREIARLSELTVIFYRLHHKDESILTRGHSLVSCLGDMIPVNPRGQAKYKFPITLETIDNSGADAEDKKDYGDRRDKDRFSLFMTSPRLAMMPRTIIDMKIVIVGASDCGVAFAEYLTLRSAQNYTQFTNLTLISPHGLPFDNKQSRVKARLLTFRGRFCSEQHRSVAARTWINIVHGTMIAINRKEKYVTVLSQGSLAYDFLILTCGRQYQKLILREEKRTQKRGMTAENQIPWNCLTVNDDTEAFVCLRKIQWLTGGLKEKKAILFYGRNIDCYCALNGLIDFGVKPAWITLIEPSLNPRETHDGVFFHDYEVDEAMMNAISRSGVQVLSQWNIIDCSLTENDDGKLMIESVTIEKEGETKSLACNALFNFLDKTINSDTFLAFSRAGLVSDGLLIIDPEFRTNDLFIFAAGTVTKYSRKFYAESCQHAYYNSVEIGERFAQILRKIIDIHRWNEEVSVLSKENVYLTPPIFRAPIVIACILLGDYYYLHIRKPGEETSHETEISQNFHGEVFVTGSCTSEIGYFRIQLNAYDSVETVTCVSRKIFQVHDMIALYGKHESMLNELKFRFRNSSISDFYAYFREPWAAAILHDKFECLRIENRATLLSRTSVHGISLVDDCVRALIKSKWEAIPEKERRNITLKYAGSVYHQQLEKNLMNFLEFCENDLPMYWTLRRQRQMYMDIEESPLYFEQ